MKFGIIDQNYMNTIAQRSDEFANMEKQLSTLIGQTPVKSTDNFLASISEATKVISGAFPVSTSLADIEFEIAWMYQFTRIDFKFLPTYAEPNPSHEDEAHKGALYTEQFYIDPDTGLNTQTSEEVDSLFLGDHPSIDDVGVGSTQGYCFNLAELSNIVTNPIIFGVDVSSDDFDSGFRPQKVPDGSIVRIQRILDARGHQHFTFDRQGIFDGVCTA